jgi:cyclopropane-fatty-acyl-phospholipid synthase
MNIDQRCTAGAAELTADLANDFRSGPAQDQRGGRPRARTLTRALTSPAAPAGRWADRALTGAILRLASRLGQGHLTLALPDGSIHRLCGQEPGPAAEIRIHHPAALRRLVFGGDIGLAESYTDGHWDTPDLPALMALAEQNQAPLEPGLRGAALALWLNRAYHRLRANSRRGSRRNIAYHYDLGNAFYGLWLDPGMTYSSALFEHPGQSMEDAQAAKYRRIGELAGLRPGARVLEIGCGWGGFMEHAAGLGAQVQGLTLSREQLAYANDRLERLGLADLAHAELTDYRDSRGQYDALVSIEMLEAVGEAHWPRYFQTLNQRLAPGAAAVVQVITIADDRFAAYRARTDFIQRHIFPGGMLPSRRVLHQQAAAAGLEIDHAETFGPSYARTLALWRGAFLDAWPDIQALGFEERFRRLWEYYLCYCEAGFESGAIDVGIYRLRHAR